MDDQKLDQILAGLKTPDVDKNKQNQAINMALAAFDEESRKKTQGSFRAVRPTGDQYPVNALRRFFMQKRYVYSGMGGAVAVCALVAVLGVPYFQQQADSLGVGRGKQTPMIIDVMQQTPKQNEPETISSVAVPESVAPLINVQRPAPQGMIKPLTDELVSGVTSSAPEVKKEKPDMAAPVRGEAESRSSTASSAIGQAAPVAKSMRAAAPAADMMMLSESGAPAGVAMERAAIAPYYPDHPAPYYQDQGRDKFAGVAENTVKSVAAEPVSTFSIDVDTASYSFVRRMINQGQLPPADAVRIEEMVNYFDYNYALPGRSEDPFKPTIAVYNSPWQQGHKLVHIGIKGFDVVQKQKSNLVFLIDTSGSMNSPDKLPLLKSSFKMMLDSLSPDDTVGIVVYAGSAGTVLPPTPVRDKGRIVQALDNLYSGGGTAGAEGIRQAYDLAEQSFVNSGNNRILLATDGDFNVGISDPEQLKNFVAQKRDKGIFLSVLGFGQGNYNDQMMQALAQNGNGNAAYIDTLSEARKVLVDDATSTLFTIAKDVKIQVEFNPALVQEYRLVGYETRKLNREDFNNDRIDAGEVGAGATVTAIYDITPVGVSPAVDSLRYGAASDEAVRGKPAPMANNGE
ncbi:MAG: von Willebrand factor type A domain-containing protein, partial [Bdellovibrionales bacterium]